MAEVCVAIVQCVTVCLMSVQWDVRSHNRKLLGIERDLQICMQTLPDSY